MSFTELLNAVPDQIPYPWHTPEGRAFYDALWDEFPFVEDIKRVTAAAGIHPGEINWNGSGKNVWRGVVDFASMQAKLYLLAIVLDQEIS